MFEVLLDLYKWGGMFHTDGTSYQLSTTYRYMNGAATNPDAHVVAYAAAQVKKGMEVAKKLGAENYGTVN